jgi:hypothetical protein
MKLLGKPGAFGVRGKTRRRDMIGALNRTDDWSEFMRRMRHEFEELIKSKPTCVQDVVQELRKREESITFLDALRDSVAEVKDTDVQVIPRQMQHHGYHASIQGPWLVCSKSKKQHDTMLFAAQAAQVLAEANLMVVPRTADQYAKSSIAA